MQRWTHTWIDQADTQDRTTDSRTDCPVSHVVCSRYERLLLYVSYLWNFRHRIVQYYWYMYISMLVSVFPIFIYLYRSFLIQACLLAYLYIYVSTYLYIYTSTSRHIHKPTNLQIYISTSYLPTCLPALLALPALPALPAWLLPIWLPSYLASLPAWHTLPRPLLLPSTSASTFTFTSTFLPSYLPICLPTYHTCHVHACIHTHTHRHMNVDVLPGFATT